MHEVSTVLVLLCIVTLLAFWTRQWSIPYRSIPYPTKRLRVSLRIVVILEGERLLKDAAGLVRIESHWLSQTASDPQTIERAFD